MHTIYKFLFYSFFTPYLKFYYIFYYKIIVMYVIYYIVFKRKKYNKIKKIYKQYIILLKLGMKNEKKQYTKMKIDFNN